MSLEVVYSDTDEFWDFFYKEIWEKRPCVLKGAFPEGTGVSDAEVVQGLAQVRKQLENPGSHPTGLQCFNDREEVAKGREGSSWLPKSSATTLEAYVNELSNRIPHKEFVFFANDFQSHSQSAWTRSRAFFYNLFRRAGIPAGNIDLILFVSRYLKSPFGVHKDSANVFLVVLKGQKRMRVWPFQALYHHVRGRVVSPRETHKLDLFDYETELKQSLLLEGNAGDVLYWPTSYWHIAEGGNTDFAVSLHQFMNRGGNVLGYFSNLLQAGASVGSYSKQPSFKPQPLSCDEEIPDVFFAASTVLVKDLTMSPQKAAAVAWLQRQAALGYGKIPAPLDLLSLKETDALQIEFPILIKEIEGEILCAGAGHVHSLPKNATVQAVVKHLNRRDVFVLDDLSDQEKFGSEAVRDLLVVKEFLEDLLRHHALRKVTELSASKQCSVVPDFQTKNMVSLGVITNADVGIF